MLSCGPTHMLTISKSLSAGQARTYHAREFTSERQNYWSRDQQGHSEWQGSLAKEWGLCSNVGAEEFARLSEGRHPESDAQLVKHQPARTYDNRYGKQITSSEHRAGWDATFSAPKSVSLTALVGGDDRVREAHRESVRVALHELERYTQARIGNVHAPETTGKFVAATFEHDTARPVDGYAAPQLHTHAVVFNVTERDNGQTRALQERSLFHLRPLSVAMIVCVGRTVKVFAWRCMNWSGIHRRASGTSMRRRQRASSSLLPSSMTPLVPWMAMPHHSFIRTRSCSI